MIILFDVLYTILLGIIGGVISSVIVSRVFMIQGEYQQQVKLVERIIRKLDSIAGWFKVCKCVFECSYDQDILIETEMKEKGYKDEMEYYAAHKDEDWISVKDLLKMFKKEISETVELAKIEIFNSDIQDKELRDLREDVYEYLHDISSEKEFNFSMINQFEKNHKEILNKFDNCKRISRKQLTKLVLKDKLMIVLYILVGLLIVFTYLAFTFGW